MNYTDFYKIDHGSGTVSMDEFISEAMRDDISLNKNDGTTFDYLKESRTTLKNEVLTCYSFLKEQGLLEQYHIYRDGN